MAHHRAAFAVGVGSLLAVIALFVASRNAPFDVALLRRQSSSRSHGTPSPSPPSPPPYTPPAPPPYPPPVLSPIPRRRGRGPARPPSQLKVQLSVEESGSDAASNASSASSPLTAPVRPKPPSFCARDPPAKDGHKGFTCMEHKCWPGPDGAPPRSLPCATQHKIEDPWGAGFFACMCRCCEVACKVSDGCNASMLEPTLPNFERGWPYH